MAPARVSAVLDRGWIGSEMGTDREQHRKLVGVIRRLEEALALLDEMDRGDGDGAAYIERAVQRAKRHLRSEHGPSLNPLPPRQAAPRRSGLTTPRARVAWPRGG